VAMPWACFRWTDRPTVDRRRPQSGGLRAQRDGFALPCKTTAPNANSEPLCTVRSSYQTVLPIPASLRQEASQLASGKALNRRAASGAI